MLFAAYTGQVSRRWRCWCRMRLFGLMNESYCQDFLCEYCTFVFIVNGLDLVYNLSIDPLSALGDFKQKCASLSPDYTWEWHECYIYDVNQNWQFTAHWVLHEPLSFLAKESEIWVTLTAAAPVASIEAASIVRDGDAAHTDGFASTCHQDSLDHTENLWTCCDSIHSNLLWICLPLTSVAFLRCTFKNAGSSYHLWGNFLSWCNHLYKQSLNSSKVLLLFYCRKHSSRALLL